MKCEIQWIDDSGRPTPDDNEAVAIAHVHKAIWLYSYGHLGNKIVGYSEEIDKSFPICEKHLVRAKGLANWSIGPLPGEINQLEKGR